MKSLANQRDDWHSVALAQHHAVVFQENQEKQYSQLNKLKYREELDEQIKSNQRLNKSSEHLKRLEFDYHQAQQLKFKEFDSQAKKNHKDYVKAFQSQNLEAVESKKKEQERLLLDDKVRMNNFFKSENEKIQIQKKKDAEIKRQRILEQQNELSRILEENRTKQRLSDIEKIRDRNLVEMKIQEMKAAENKHSEIVKQKFMVFENRLQKISDNFQLADEKNSLINKRQVEHEAFLNAKEAQDQLALISKKQETIKNMQEGLKSQINQKSSIKKLERDQDKKYQQEFKKEAIEDQYYQNLNRFTKKLEQERLRDEYNKQLIEKRSISYSKFKMNEEERKINNKLLEKIPSENLSFPSVPGFNSNNSPAKLSFDRIYSKQRLKRELERAESVKSAKNQMYWVSNERHNPITNPIGTSNPRVFPGQRIVKGHKSAEKEPFSVKDLLTNC